MRHPSASAPPSRPCCNVLQTPTHVLRACCGAAPPLPQHLQHAPGGCGTAPTRRVRVPAAAAAAVTQLPAADARGTLTKLLRTVSLRQQQLEQQQHAEVTTASPEQPGLPPRQGAPPPPRQMVRRGGPWVLRQASAAVGMAAAAPQQQQQQQQQEQQHAEVTTASPGPPRQGAPPRQMVRRGGPRALQQASAAVGVASTAPQQQQQRPGSEAQPSGGPGVPAVASTREPQAAAGDDASSQQQQPSGVHFDPSELPIKARVKVLTGNAAARRGRQSELAAFCSAHGLGSAAASHVQDHASKHRISTAPELLAPFLQCYLRLAAAYGEPVVLEWLRRAPPVIRAADEVPERLAQLQHLLGGVELCEVLALTRRCPMVLGVSSSLLASRMQQLCSLLGRPFLQQGPQFLTAAPALLAMQPDTLAVKLERLQALAATHRSWSEAYASIPPKSLAILLTYSLDRHARLSHVAALGVQDRLSMSTIMAWSKSKWQEEFPDCGAAAGAAKAP